MLFIPWYKNGKTISLNSKSITACENHHFSRSCKLYTEATTEISASDATWNPVFRVPGASTFTSILCSFIESRWRIFPRMFSSRPFAGCVCLLSDLLRITSSDFYSECWTEGSYEMSTFRWYCHRIFFPRLSLEVITCLVLINCFGKLDLQKV